jgi:hypothetical protein
VSGANSILTRIFRFREDVESDPDQLINDLKKHGYKVEDDLILKLVTHNGGSIGFFEKRIGLFIPLGFYLPSLRVIN